MKRLTRTSFLSSLSLVGFMLLLTPHNPIAWFAVAANAVAALVSLVK